jgi:hypothetical protein
MIKYRSTFHLRSISAVAQRSPLMRDFVAAPNLGAPGEGHGVDGSRAPGA